MQNHEFQILFFQLYHTTHTINKSYLKKSSSLYQYMNYQMKQPIYIDVVQQYHHCI